MYFDLHEIGSVTLYLTPHCHLLLDEEVAVIVGMRRGGVTYRLGRGHGSRETRPLRKGSVGID